MRVRINGLAGSTRFSKGVPLHFIAGIAIGQSISCGACSYHVFIISRFNKTLNVEHDVGVTCFACNTR